MVDATDTQPQTYRSAALDLLAMLVERYPAPSNTTASPRQPLAIGIRRPAAQDLGIAPAVVNLAMQLYTRRRSVPEALTQPGAMRVDLDGRPTEPVSQEHQATARAPRTRAAASPAQPDAGPVPHPRPVERTDSYGCHCHLEAGTPRYA